jgi:hypothetical protein
MSFPKFTVLTISGQITQAVLTTLLTTLQTNIAHVLNTIASKSQLDSNVLYNQTLSSGSNTIPHGQSNGIKSYIVSRVRSQTAVNIYETSAPDGTYIYLESSGNATIDITVWS